MCHSAVLRREQALRSKKAGKQRLLREPLLFPLHYQAETSRSPGEDAGQGCGFRTSTETSRSQERMESRAVTTGHGLCLLLLERRPDLLS